MASTPIPIPTPVAAPATPTPISPTHQKIVELGTVVGLDVLTGIIAVIFGHQIGRQVAKWFSRSRGGIPEATTSVTPATTPGATPPEPADTTIHSLPFGIGARDEGEAGMTLGNVFWQQRKKLAKLVRVIGFIANKLNQGQRDFLREAVGHMKTAKIQANFWQNLVLASGTEKSFMNFMKTMGIVRDTPEHTHELGKAIAKGLADANTYCRQTVRRERTQIRREIRAALQKP